MQGSCEDLAAFASTVHVALPAEKDVSQLCSEETGLIFVYQPGHSIFRDSTYFLFIKIYIINCSRMLVGI